MKSKCCILNFFVKIIIYSFTDKLIIYSFIDILIFSLNEYFFLVQTLLLYRGLSVVGILGLLAAALSFGAEAKKIKVYQLRYSSDTDCIFPRTPAVPLGLAAVVALTIAQTIVNIMTNCLCCRPGPYQLEPIWTKVVFCNTMSWFAFTVAILLLLAGVAMNSERGEKTIYFGSNYCYVVKPGVFAGGAVFSLATVGLGILSYINFELANNNDHWGGPAANGEHGIAMGQIQFCPPDMIFVSGNTYVRRQTDASLFARGDTCSL